MPSECNQQGLEEDKVSWVWVEEFTVEGVAELGSNEMGRKAAESMHGVGQGWLSQDGNISSL